MPIPEALRTPPDAETVEAIKLVYRDWNPAEPNYDVIEQMLIKYGGWSMEEILRHATWGHVRAAFDSYYRAMRKDMGGIAHTTTHEVIPWDDPAAPTQSRLRPAADKPTVTRENIEGHLRDYIRKHRAEATACANARVSAAKQIWATHFKQEVVAAALGCGSRDPLTTKDNRDDAGPNLYAEFRDYILNRHKLPPWLAGTDANAADDIQEPTGGIAGPPDDEGDTYA